MRQDGIYNCQLCLFLLVICSIMGNRSSLRASLPAEVEETARHIGANIRLARRRRRISEEAFASQMLVTRPTLQRLERGDATVSAGAVYAALWALGLLKNLDHVADPASDELGLQEQLRRAGGKRQIRDVDF